MISCRVRAPAITSIIALACLAVFAGCSKRDRDDTLGHVRLTAADSAAARAVVIQFGHRLQRVSLLAPDSLVRAAIRSEYAPFVSPALLDTWLDRPASAPGRQTSSPWPDRIEISRAAATSNGGTPHIAYLGAILERTSDTPPGGASGRIQVRVTVGRGPDGWRIAQFDQVQGSARSPEPSATGADTLGADTLGMEPSPELAADVIREYYRAIAEHRYRDAYSMWGSNRQTFETFERGFAGTASVEVDVAPPGRIGAAAGSRYIEVPVLIRSRRTDGTRQSFAGTYTLRRSVVDGATPDQRAWRIYSAEIRPSP